MTTIEQIKAEIERQIKDPQEHCYGVSSINKLRELLDFIGTLEVEKPNQDELDKEIEEYFPESSFYTGFNSDDVLEIARHFAKWGAEHTHPEKMLGGVYSSYDMAKAYVEGQNNILTNLDKYNLMRRPKSPSSGLKETEKPIHTNLEEAAWGYASKECEKAAFIAGAKWQADHTPLPEDTVLFNTGVEEGKWLMMEDAVKWLVDDDYHEASEKGRFILGSVGLGYNGYYIPYLDLLKLPKKD